MKKILCFICLITFTFGSDAAYFFTKFMAKEFGHLFAEYGMGSNMGYENFEYKKEYSLYDEIVFWFPINKNSPSQKEEYKNSFL